MAVLDAATVSKEHASRCARALPVSPATLGRVGVMAGAAASVLGVISGWRKRRNMAARQAEKSSASPVSLVVQMLVPFLMPVLQRSLQKVVDNQNKSSFGQKMGF
ncbi:MAG: hypothetical protein UHH87_06680 [Akkermansia sp.]|nr:hypothetical protein [Akkermansia sp.]